MGVKERKDGKKKEKGLGKQPREEGGKLGLRVMQYSQRISLLNKIERSTSIL